MQISSGIQMIGLALYIKEHDALVISDTHIGYESELNAMGVMIPRTQYSSIIKRLDNITKGKRFSKIVVNGDIKHKFGTISDQEWRDTLEFLDYLKKRSDTLILIKGNHDTILDKISNKKGIALKVSLRLGTILITHGDKLIRLSKDIDTIIIGHEHPAISIREEARVEKFKCFLKGKYRGRSLIVQPSFNTLNIGKDILEDDHLSPFLKQDLSNFDVYIIEDKAYYFGKLSSLV